jgi:tRNA uridine 5-carboxymethylaminomethyl modification enzyme
MGINADATGIQFRMLNRSKGASVRAPRVQCDKKAYQFRLKAQLERQPGLEILQTTVSGLLVEDESVRGVETDIGVSIRARTIVITAGTFCGLTCRRTIKKRWEDGGWKFQTD